MANSPIQVVLNTSDFIEAWDRSGGGPNKDFFAGEDAAFINHKDEIYNQLQQLKNTELDNGPDSFTYAKVTLQQSALAKVHRPTNVVFKPELAPVVGAGDLGELFVEVSNKAIASISKKVTEAETQTRWKQTPDGKTKPNPSRLRSEVGAIKAITPYTKGEKRKFEISEGLQWLANPKTGGGYLVELFENIPARNLWDTLSRPKYQMFKNFVEGLENLMPGLIISKVSNGQNGVMFSAVIEESQNKAVLNLNVTQSGAVKNTSSRSVNLSVDDHGKLISFLETHPIVKKIMLPSIVVQSSDSVARVTSDEFKIPPINPASSYPKICVVDGGVSDLYGDWIEDRWGYISPDDKDEDHGTFISGLAIIGEALNGTAICKEVDGCKIIDLDILPMDGKHSLYYKTTLQFFEELESAVQQLTARTGVRIFNFSLNFEEHASSEGYSLAAQTLDRIAEENDVIFVISAGNTRAHDTRKEWPSDPVQSLKILAMSRNDIIKKPAESCRNISVSALNPPHLDGIVPYALSNYSCRGPGLRIGLKPDLAHIGGCGTKHVMLGHGLLSLNKHGQVVDDCGTSYAAPNVSKTLASLDHAIEGMVSRETLMALSIHHAELPSILNDKSIKSLAKHLVGFGIPNGSEEILNGKDSAITLVFANRTYRGKKLTFNFTWPASLVKNGKCIGHAKLTIVSTPMVDYRYGAEFVRINIDAHLRQQQDDGGFKGRLDPIYTPDDNEGNQYEKNQIEHAFKWSPVKVYEKKFPKGVGPSTHWKLDVEYLERDGEILPPAGVPFTVLLTISDPKGVEPVFNDMRQMLQSLGVQTVDIKTAARVVQRV